MSKGRRVARRTRRLRPAVLLWSSCAIAALVLALGSSGTLSSWTQAIIANSNNSTATAKAVILQETNGGNTCNSSDGAQTTINSSTCTTINKYGGTTTPLTPGGTAKKVDVTFKNIGTANGTSFQLAPASCGQNPAAGSGTPVAANVCTNGDLTIAVSCSPGSSYNSGTAWTDLAYAAAAPPTGTKTHTATGTELNAGQSWTCEFSIALKPTAGIADQGITVSQALTWTLNG